MKITLFNLLLIAGVIQGFIFNAVTVLNMKKLSRVIVFLNLTVLFLSLNNLQAWLIENHYSSNVFFIKKLLVPWYMLICPMFYLFLTNYLRVKNQLKKLLKFSLIIFLAQLVIRIGLILYVEHFILDKNDYIIETYTSSEEIFNAFFGVFIIYKCIYLVFRQKDLYKYILRYDDIKWIKNFLFLGGLVFIFWFYAIIINITNDSKWAYYPLRLGTSILLYWIGYQGFYRYNIVKDRILLRRNLNSQYNDGDFGYKRDTDNALNNDTNKYQKDFNTINDYVLKDKRFLDPYFGMEKLSCEINMSLSHISKVINSSNDFNFSDYINSLRIEQAKKLLSNAEFDRYTVVAIGLECGFNSKSTFYTSFKKFTSQTPSEFRSQN